MRKIIVLSTVVATAVLLTSCTGKTEQAPQANVDVKAPVVQVDSSTTGALANQEFVNELDKVVSESLEKAINSTGSANGSANTAPAPTTTTPAPETSNTPTPAPKAGE